MKILEQDTTGNDKPNAGRFSTEVFVVLYAVDKDLQVEMSYI